MKIGILVGELTQERSLIEAVDLVRDMGYECVELPANSEHEVEEAEKFASAIRDKGLEITGFQCHVGYLQPGWENNVQHTKRVIDVADRINVPVVHTVTAKLPEDVAVPEGWKRLVTAYNEMLDHAASTKVKLGIEPVFVYFVGNYETTKRVFEEVGRDDFYMNFDPSHFPYHGESPIPIIKDFGERIIHTHMKDAITTPNFKFVPPGQGILDFDEMLIALKDVGYDGVLSLELGHGMLEGAAPENVKFFEDLLGRLGI